MMKMKKPELLSPAGDWEKLQMAVLYGADAVYLAGTSFGMRSFAGNFDDEALPKVGPDTKLFTITVPVMRDSEGNGLAEPKTPQMVFTMQLPRPVPPMSFIRHAVALSGK